NCTCLLLSPHPTVDIRVANNTAPPPCYTLSLHDALPISWPSTRGSAATGSCSRETSGRMTRRTCGRRRISCRRSPGIRAREGSRSEEHTSELQSHLNLVCRLLLEKKKITVTRILRLPLLI